MSALVFAGAVCLAFSACTDQAAKPGASAKGGNANGGSGGSGGGSGGTVTGGASGGTVTGGTVTGGSGGTVGGGSGGTVGGGSGGTVTGGSGGTVTGGSGGTATGGTTGGHATGGSGGTATGGHATGGSGGTATGGHATGGSGGSTGGSGGSTGGAGGSAGGTGGSAGVLIGTTTFVDGKGDGDLNGYGWVALGADDTLTSPTCGADMDPITEASPCGGTTNWSSDTALCMTGSVPALSDSPTSTEYAANWGVQVGVDATTKGGQIGKSFASIAFEFSGTPATGVRAIVHQAGTTGGTSYCYDGIESGTAVALSKFNTKCWPGSAGTAFNPSNAAKIDKVMLQISSTDTDITVEDFCLESITLK
jgi:hypothetical protein